MKGETQFWRLWKHFGCRGPVSGRRGNVLAEKRDLKTKGKLKHYELHLQDDYKAEAKSIGDDPRH